MTSKKHMRVGEPVQVYLDAAQRQRLDGLVAQLALSKAAVIRLSLESLERQILDPATHPALRIIGIAERESDDQASSSTVAPSDLDRYLVDAEVKSWTRGTRKKRGR